MARRLVEVPETRAGLEAGELSEDTVALVCRKARAAVDAEVAQLARSTTMTQLRCILGPYSFHDKPEPEKPEKEEAPAASELRRVSFKCTETGWWRLSAELPADEGRWLSGP
jgi:hypothetical protein